MRRGRTVLHKLPTNGAAGTSFRGVVPSDRMEALSGGNIFAQFSALSVKHGSVNLGQGFPSYGAPNFVSQALVETMAGDSFEAYGKPQNLNQQYTRPGGEPTLVQQLAKIYSCEFNREIDPMSEMITTIGAQEGIFTVMHAFTNPGDEVVIITPSFDAFFKSAAVMGLTLRGVSLKPGAQSDSEVRSVSDWTIDEGELRAAINPNTKLLIINTPSSPLGKMYSRNELEMIAGVVRDHPSLLLLADEVYERAAFDGTQHERIATLDGMWGRTISLFSAGKTFSTTGWRCGYMVAAPELVSPMIASHAAMNFGVPTPIQQALASCFAQAERPHYASDLRYCDGADAGGESGNYYQWLSNMMQKKRDQLVEALQVAGMRPIVPQGGYFVVADSSVLHELSGISTTSPGASSPLDDRPDVKVCKWATEHLGVTMMPCSPFYLPEDRGGDADRLVRFAFCKDEESIRLGCEKLKAIANASSSSKARL